MEERIRAAVLKEGLRFLRKHLEQCLPRQLGLERIAGSRGCRTRKILTALGETQVRRLYVPGQGCPLDAALGLEGRYTPTAAEMLCHAAAMDESYGKGEAALRVLAGIEVAGRSLQRLVNRVSPEMEAEGADLKRATPAPGQRTDTQLDMTGVPMRPEDLADTRGQDGKPKKKQLKVGVSFFRERDADGQWSVVKSTIAHTVAYETPEEFGKRLRDWARTRGMGASEVHTVTADGAAWIWELVDGWFPQAVQVVDFFHACEHLDELCTLMHPGDKRAAEGLFAMRRRMLKAHGAGCLVRYFENHAAESPSKDEILAKLSYFRTNLHRMEYGKFRKAGLVIGSGVLEGSCRSLVNQRADLSGQRWHPEGALNVLRIRGMIIDGIHAAYWTRRGCLRRQTA